MVYELFIVDRQGATWCFKRFFFLPPLPLHASRSATCFIARVVGPLIIFRCGFLTTAFVEKSGEGLRYLSADNDYLWARPSCSRAKHNFECFPRCFTISAGTHVYISAEISRQDKKTDPKRCVMRNFISCCAEWKMCEKRGDEFDNGVECSDSRVVMNVSKKRNNCSIMSYWGALSHRLFIATRSPLRRGLWLMDSHCASMLVARN